MARVDLRRGLLGQCHFELFEQKQEVPFGLGITGENDCAAVRGGKVDVEHLHSGKLLEHGSWSQAASEGFQTGLEGNLQAVIKERDKDVGLNAVFELVVDWTNGQVTFEFSESLFDLRKLEVVFPKFCGVFTAQDYA